MQMRWLALRTRVVDSPLPKTRLPFSSQLRQYNVRRHEVSTNPHFEKQHQRENERRATQTPRFDRPRPPDDVPFVEGEELGINDQSYFSEHGQNPTLTLAQLERRSTISHVEKAAFARLFDKVGLPQYTQDASAISGQSGGGGGVARLTGLDAAVGKRFEATGRARQPVAMPASLQEMLAGMQARTTDKELQTSLIQARKESALAEKERLLPFVQGGQLEGDQLEDGRDEEQISAETITVDPRLQQLRESHHSYVEAKLLAAQTDQELWQVLEDEAFKIIEGLDLDSTTASNPTKPKKKPTKTGKKGKAAKVKAEDSTTIESASKANTITTITSTADLLSLDPTTRLAVIGANYPSLLLQTTQTLTTSFPTSTLPLHILPTLRSIGPSSYILGASTPLYNALISYNHLILSDFDAINRLLGEMENAALDFDLGTHRLLRNVRREGYRNFDGRGGEVERGVWLLGGVQEGWKGVMGWWPVVCGRLGLVGRGVEVEEG